jgi:uncharacterized protein YbjT (DUF2867 family)
MSSAWVAGGSGLVGGILLRTLLDARRFERVVSVGRRTLALEHPRLVQVRTELAPEPRVGDAPAPDVAFCALGTTIKKAGSREAFRRVDHDAVVAFARAARARGARCFVHVTALGADPGSRVFYNAVKGEVERSVAALGFDAVYALRPSILDGPRAESRPAERVGLAVARALGPLLGKYRPTPAEAVARAMIALAARPAAGAHVVEPDEIARAAREGPA